MYRYHHIIIENIAESAVGDARNDSALCRTARCVCRRLPYFRRRLHYHNSVENLNACYDRGITCWRKCFMSDGAP